MSLFPKVSHSNVDLVHQDKMHRAHASVRVKKRKGIVHRPRMPKGKLCIRKGLSRWPVTPKGTLCLRRQRGEHMLKFWYVMSCDDIGVVYFIGCDKLRKNNKYPELDKLKPSEK